MISLSIAWAGLRRYVLAGRNFVQLFVLPFLLILLLGLAFGGSSDVSLGVVDLDDSTSSTELADGLRELDGLDVVEHDAESGLIRDVERGRLQAGLVIPAGYESSLQSGSTAQLRYVSTTGQARAGPITAARAVAAEQATLVQAARFSAERDVAGFDEALAMARVFQTNLPPVEVIASEAGEPFTFELFDQFDSAAHSQLVLFMFLTTLGGAVTLIETRRLGVARRMLATPASVRDIIIGEGLMRFGLAVFQGLLIMLGAWAVFGVNWGDPVGAVFTLLVFALVASGAAMLLGAVVGNEQQAGGLVALFGLGLAALGGAMVPLAALKFLSESVWQLAHVTPHAWAIESFEELVAADGGLGDIAGFLAILVAYAVVLYALATWRLHRALTR
jgi:ABC-2 type transport system permease protein